MLEVSAIVADSTFEEGQCCDDDDDDVFHNESFYDVLLKNSFDKTLLNLSAHRDSAARSSVVLPSPPPKRRKSLKSETREMKELVNALDRSFDQFDSKRRSRSQSIVNVSDEDIEVDGDPSNNNNSGDTIILDDSSSTTSDAEDARQVLLRQRAKEKLEKSWEADNKKENEGSESKKKAFDPVYKSSETNRVDKFPAASTTAVSKTPARICIGLTGDRRIFTSTPQRENKSSFSRKRARSPDDNSPLRGKRSRFELPPLFEKRGRVRSVVSRSSSHRAGHSRSRTAPAATLGTSQSTEFSDFNVVVQRINSECNHVVFVDLDNYVNFFGRLEAPFPLTTFVWAFWGAKTDWYRPVGNCFFDDLVRTKRFEETIAGTKKDAADFALVLRIGLLHHLLHPEINFTIVSGDRGFEQIKRDSVDWKRNLKILNPHWGPNRRHSFSLRPGQFRDDRLHCRSYSCRTETRRDCQLYRQIPY